MADAPLAYPPLPAKRKTFVCTECGSDEADASTLHLQHPTCGGCGFLGFVREVGYTEDDMHAYVDASRAAPPSPPVAAPAEPCQICGEGTATLLVTRYCDVCESSYAGDAETKMARALTQPPRPGTAPLFDDLLERCRELLAWRKTGKLEGDALRRYASALECPDYLRLRLAESQTADEAFEFVVAHGIGHPTTPTPKD